jgi:penicillin-binding protein 1C
MAKDVFASLNIVGLRDKQLIRALPGMDQVSVDLKPEGGFGEKWWFLDGNLVANTKDNEKVALTITEKGIHRLLLLDESGQIFRLNFISD